MEMEPKGCVQLKALSLSSGLGTSTQAEDDPEAVKLQKKYLFKRLVSQGGGRC